MPDSKSSGPPSLTYSFIDTFVLPAVWIFAIPVGALLLFPKIQVDFERRFGEAMAESVRADAELDVETRAELIAFFNRQPLPELIQQADEAGMLTDRARFDHQTFVWMIRLAWISIAATFLVLMLCLICVAFSFSSQTAQYVALSVGWHFLRLFVTLQVMVQGVLVAAMSYWVPAYALDRYSRSLFLLGCGLAVVAFGTLLWAMFKRTKLDFEVEGEVIDRELSPQFWHKLEEICKRVGTSAPDHVIAGIDDKFFVTEFPVSIDGKLFHGRSLHISLALLKQLNGTEADAVLAHEMAHFSGKDTLFSRKILPLQQRYEHFLDTLYKEPISKPVFHFMHLFWALFELSLSHLRREREFRADAIAGRTTSPQVCASALLRAVAYSCYRSQLVLEQLTEDELLRERNLMQRVERGFPAFAAQFLSDPSIADSSSAHPFDSHPPLHERIEGLGFKLDSVELEAALQCSGNAAWYDDIAFAPELEQQLWSKFEDELDRCHTEALQYRFLPTTSAEREIVEQAFPMRSFMGSLGTLIITCDSIELSSWPEGKIPFSSIEYFWFDQDHKVRLDLGGAGTKRYELNLRRLSQSEEAYQTLREYVHRYIHAQTYQADREATRGEHTCTSASTAGASTPQ